MRVIDMLARYNTTVLISSTAPRKPKGAPKRVTIVQYIKDNPKCTKAAIMRDLGITERAAANTLHLLHKAGVIGRSEFHTNKGRGRPGSIYWVQHE
jgi:predicted ArsR family transcriptional regulator